MPKCSDFLAVVVELHPRLVAPPAAPAARQPGMIRLADAMQRARYAVAAAWLVAAVISIAAVSGAFGTKLNDLLSNRFDLPGRRASTRSR